jgi:ribonuclease BN (tRNA processing enzyme)
MKIRLLGAHLLEDKDNRLACCLIDGILAIDAGSLTATLTFQEQLNIKALLLTHHHYDHIRDVLTLGATFYNNNAQCCVYSIPVVYDALQYLFNYPGTFYTNVMEKPQGNPALKFIPVEPLKPFHVVSYNILAVPVNHSTPSVGFQITAPNGKRLFYTGDTGPGLEDCWQQINPDLLIIENSASDRFIERAREVKHLSPTLLKEELIHFQKIKGYLPGVITTHMYPDEREEADRRVELERISKELGVSITIGYEGMEIVL